MYYAIAEAAIRAGVEAYFGYPITPQTELLEHMARRMPELNRAFLQAESEVAAINMVYEPRQERNHLDLPRPRGRREA